MEKLDVSIDKMDIQSSPDVNKVDLVTPKTPVFESIDTVDRNIGSTGSPVIEEVPKENTYQLFTESFEDEETPEGIYEQGDIQQIDYSIAPGSELGATDRYGNYYSNALEEGKEILVGGISMTVKYGDYFSENGFLIFTGKDDLRIGKVFPYMSFIPTNKYGKSLDAVNYPEMHQGTEIKKIQTDIRGDVPPVYAVIPCIVGFQSRILPDRVDNGKVINFSPEGFEINRSGITQTDRGYLSPLLVAVRNEKDENGDHFTLEVLGYLEDNDISFDLNALPDELVPLAE